MNESVEVWFERFRVGHDAVALGRVFDAVSDELFAVALHLAGDRATAEDLLQATFLLAMRRAGRWHAGRPLRPWLFGILEKEMRNWRRKRARQSRPVPAPPPSAEPLQPLLARETRDAVAAAIETLPEPYRTVVDLRLVHQLSPDAIAARLARSSGSVRTQLWRGLERLRAVLPPGLALGGAFVLARPALAHVRAQVIAAANAPAAPVPVFAGLFAIGMAKVAVTATIALAGVVAMTTWWCLRVDEPARTGTLIAAAAAASAVTSAPTLDGPSREPAPSAAAREEVPVGANELRQLAPRLLYEAMRRGFAAREEATASLARTLLAELLLTGPGKQSEVAAILAAWLDHGAPAKQVVTAGLDAIPDDSGEYDDYHGRTAALTLALAFTMRPHDIPGASPAVATQLLGELIARVDGEIDARHRGAALAIALQRSDSTAAETVSALLRLASSPVYAVRGSAMTAMAYAMTPAALLAAVDVAPRVLCNQSEHLDECSRLFALRIATERHPKERAVYVAWVASRLKRPRDLQVGVVEGPHPCRPEATFFRDLIGNLSARDVEDLRRELEAVAAGEDEVARWAREALGKRSKR